MKTLLLIIDMQNDFCNPDGALYVNGADKDVQRLGKFITNNSERIAKIIMTQDNHHVIDISHPEFWEDRQGKPPVPLTVISIENIQEGLWKPRFRKESSIGYIRKLEDQGEFPHVIWPEHCITGSYGAAIVNEIMEPVKDWARKGNFFDVIIKGTNPYTEHFGALKAHVTIKGSPETQLNTGLVKELQNSDKILIAGEARSHCVATTVKQMLEVGGLAHKLFILEDCMSDVSGFETIALPIYEKAKKEGARFISSSDTNWQ